MSVINAISLSRNPNNHRSALRHGLEDQVSGLRHVGEEYANPNGLAKQRQGRRAFNADVTSSVSGRLPQAG